MFNGLIYLTIKGTSYIYAGLMPAMKNIVERARLMMRGRRLRSEVSASGYAIRLDNPLPVFEGPFSLLYGVLFTPEGERPSDVYAVQGANEIRLLLHERPDLVRSIKGVESTGFVLICPHDSPVVEVVMGFRSGGEDLSHAIQLKFSGVTIEELQKRQKVKRQCLDGILACPACKHELSEVQDSCPSCGRKFNAAFDYRTGEMGGEIDRSVNGNISAHNYDEKAIKLIEKHKDGLILDNGCGLRQHYYDNVLNFEIENYPTTDVLGVGEELPFRDGSFDAVFSLSVLEHVRDPFKCAKEILRVLKPGGDLFVAVPFLQPFHGYPNHYYNMTSSGLKNLFGDSVEISEMGVSRPGHPFWALQWFLRNYSHGLSDAEARRFEDLRVKDIIEADEELKSFLLSNLNERKREELASFNYFLGKKPS